MKVSRGFEKEADLLGLQYVYKTGYDPTAFIDFFERMEALDKKKPGTMSELFRSHPKIANGSRTRNPTLRRPSGGPGRSIESRDATGNEDERPTVTRRP